MVRPVDAADVMSAVDYARENGLDLSVRGGSHSAPGFGTSDDGVVIDLSRMRGVRVDPQAQTARPEGGCTWGDFFHATCGFGAATTGGIISTTGVGGLTLGGGIGHEFYRDYIEKAPEQMGAFFAFQIAPPLPFVPQNRHGETLCLIVACWAGPLERGEKELEPIRRAGPVAAHLVTPMPFPALNGAFDALLPPGLQHYWKASFATKISDGAIAAHLQHGPKVPVVNSTMHIYPINGACNRVKADATAFAYRDAKFATVIAGMWPEPADDGKNTHWVKDCYAGLQPHSAAGGYVNFMADDDQGRVRDNYKGNYERLAQIKKKYDPTNLFHINQNIKPA